MLPQEIVYTKLSSTETQNGWIDFLTTKPLASQGIEWTPLIPTAHVLSIFMVLFMIAILTAVYYTKLKKLKPTEPPTGYVLVVQLLILQFENLTVDLLGEKNRRLSLLFIIIFVYILISNLMSMVGGIAAPTSSSTVTFSLGLMSFFGTFIMGVKYQKLAYFRDFFVIIKIKKKTIPLMINPLNVIGYFAPLLSISLRLWGNVLAGSIFIALLYSLFRTFFTLGSPSSFSVGLVFGTLAGGLVIPAFHVYFDILVSAIQAFVFVSLMLTYWSQPIKAAENAAEEKHQQMIENQRLNVK
ncbi:ATP synthase F0 a chain [Mycoplasmoides gallisepticum str. F]|uniref:F0F1 ATP synthase subunit A n=1 Tax=Mycoplasmoides gallisepticum TaxID=2096 RepID=UPI0001C3990B|nr:F0F1 ATP synthase subunit A [Mycoplasmoides gallisepticum]ADC31465.1 ATP synthase F0 a chain [Mycoplasmoides gallisepticum str. F]